MHLGKVQTGTSYRRVFLIFVLIAVIFTVVVLYFVLGKAEIKIIPKATSKEIEFHFAVDSNIEEGKYERGLIPGQHIYNDINDTVTITELPKREVDDLARGKVIFRNESAQARPLIVDTQLETSGGLIFLTDKRVDVPADGDVEVTVRAEKVGKEYNIGPGRFDIKLLPHLSSVLYAESTEDMTGGTVEKPVVDRESLKTLLEKAENQLRAALTTGIQADVEEGHNLNEDSITFEIESYTPVNPEIVVAGNSLIFTDEEMEFLATDDFKIKIEGHVSAFAYKEEEILQVAQVKSQDLLNDEFEYQKLTGDATIIPVTFEKSDPMRDKCYFVGNVKVDVLHNLPEDAFNKKKLAGFNKADIVRYYQKLEIADEVSVSFWPFWIRNVPVNTSRINIIVEENVLKEKADEEEADQTEDETPVIEETEDEETSDTQSNQIKIIRDTS